MEGAQSGEEQPAEQGAEHADRQQEGRACGYPARPIARDAPAGHAHVDVGMMGESGSPGVKNGGDADPGAEVPGISGGGQHRIGRRLEHKVIDPSLKYGRAAFREWWCTYAQVAWVSDEY